MIAHDQTIVYCVHPEAGHLGVFVSSAVARKEHSEFTENMDQIDVLPSGLWEPSPCLSHQAMSTGTQYSANMSPDSRRGLDDIRALGLNSVEEDRRFATVARLEEINAQLYKSWIHPFVQATANASAAEWMRRLAESAEKSTARSEPAALTGRAPGAQGSCMRLTIAPARLASNT